MAANNDERGPIGSDASEDEDLLSGGLLSEGGPSIGRREFLLGSAGVALAVFGTTAILSGCAPAGEDEEVVATELDVPENRVLVSSDFDELDVRVCVNEDTHYDLPMGSIGTMDADDLVVFVTPGETADVVAQIAFLGLASGNYVNVLERPISLDEGYQIYDARANDDVCVWVESNFRSDDWRLYLAPVINTAQIGTPILVDEGDANFDPPMLCVCGSRAFWTHMPNENGDATDSDSYLKVASFSAPNPEVVFTSHGRMITNPQATDGIVTIVPRAETKSARYQMTAIDAATGEVLAAQILPSTMRVLDAIYLNGSFVFGVERSYNFEGGISLFGTYSAMDDGHYLRFNRVPMDTPAICDRFLVIKSTKSVVGVDMNERSYFAIDTVDGCESYGDFLLSTGTSSRIVTYTSVPAGDGSGNGLVRVRVFSVLPPGTELPPEPVEPEGEADPATIDPAANPTAE